ncbi:MAG TPA: hypothetical protein P5234_00830 [Thermoanaerobaculaceae bacterium]|nr:hypothetical protein [Thermoanaerobaculaceae bacterium]HRS14772.1 hypothetical protein [Thermoanaerobaculaceae bacterium]
MKTFALALAVAAGTALAADGEEVVARLGWEGRSARPDGASVRVIGGQTGGEAAHLRVERAAPGLPVPLLAIEAPPVSTSVYAVRGRVRHEGVEGEGFLEMWSVFPDGSRFFSRTLASRGPLRSLTGTSGWRHFVLPFTTAVGQPAPSRLEINLVLPGRGVVELGPLELVTFGPGEDPLVVPGSWWTARQAGLVGGLLGLLLGSLGALTGVLASRRRAPRLAVATLVAIGIVGLAALAVGAVALAMRQPWEVFYPLLLGGGIGTALALTLLGGLRRRRTAEELQRLRARDIGR